MVDDVGAIVHPSHRCSIDAAEHNIVSHTQRHTYRICETAQTQKRRSADANRPRKGHSTSEIGRSYMYPLIKLIKQRRQ